MKTWINKYLGKSIVAILLSIIILLRTPEAAVLDSPDPIDSIVSSEMTEYTLYESSLPNTKDIKAYKRYIKKYLSSEEKYPGYSAVVYDINCDGIYEMFYRYESGIRYACKIYTYKKGKIIKMKELNGCTNICCNQKKKLIYVDFPQGASHSISIFYKMKSKKLKKVSEYEAIFTENPDGTNKGRYYKNGKRISEKNIESSKM